MPTAKPRINLTVDPHRYDLLKRLAAAQGASMSAVVSEVLEPVYPVLERVCVVLEAAKMAKATQLSGLRDAAAAAEADLVPIMYRAVNQFDLFIGDASASLGLDIPTMETAEAAIKRITGKGSSTLFHPLAVTDSDGMEECALDPQRVIRGSGSNPPPKSSSKKKAAKPLMEGVSSDLTAECTCSVTDSLRVWNKSCPRHRRG